MDSSKVSSGIGTYAGLGTAFAAFASGIVSIFVTGDYTEETITAFAIGTVTLVTTLIGRFSQAKAQIQVAPSIAAVASVKDIDIEVPIEVERGVGSLDEPYHDEPDLDIMHEQRDIHSAPGF